MSSTRHGPPFFLSLSVLALCARALAGIVDAVL